MPQEKKDETKVMDKALGVDYSYLLNRTATDTVVVTPEEIANEDTELLKAFLEANSDVKPYIDTAKFDPSGLCAKHIINLCKDKTYKVKVSDKELRLPEAIMLKAMSDCYSYVTSIAKALAEKSGNRSSIQLSDKDVFDICENFFRLGTKRADIKITNDTVKATPTKSAVTSATTGKTEKTAPKKEESAQVSLFDFGEV